MAHLAHYKQAHPLPMKVTHWVNLVCMALLIFTGFLIHFPFWAGLTGVARGVHVFCGMLLVLNCILRIIFAALTFLAIDSSLQYIIKGLIILVACSLDMRKYLVKK